MGKFYVAMAALAGFIIASAGFEAGRYISTQKHERIALSRSCGFIDADTLEFKYNDPLALLMDNIETIKPQRKPMVKR